MIDKVGFSDLLDSRYIPCPFKPQSCQNLIVKVRRCLGIRTPQNRGLFYRRCNACEGFEWVSPLEWLDADGYRSRVAPQDGANGLDFDEDSSVDIDMDGIDRETLIRLRALYPEDFPAPASVPGPDDGEIARLMASMPENDAAFMSSFGPSTLSAYQDDTTSLPNFPATFDPCLDNSDFGFGMDLNFAMLDALDTSDFSLGLESSASLAVAAATDVTRGAPEAVPPPLPAPSPHTDVERRLKPGSSRFYCITKGCTKTCRSDRCTRFMCNTHCIDAGGCFAHPRPARSSAETLASSSSLPLGPSLAVNNVISARSSSTVIPVPTVATTSRAPMLFSSSMDTEHYNDWKKGRDAQKKADEEQASQHEFKRRYEKQVKLYLWLKDDEPPTHWSEQSIPTWPKINLAHSTRLCSLLHLTTEQVSEAWILRYNIRALLWTRTALDMVFEVDALKHEVATIFLSAENVKSCLDFDKYCLPPPSSSPSKRSRSLTLSEETPRRPAKVARFSVDSDITDSVNAPSPSPLATAPSPSPLLPAESSTLHLSSSSVTWPGDLFTCDVAPRIARLAAHKGHRNPQLLFENEFPGWAFPRSKINRHKVAWMNSTQEERNEAINAPRDRNKRWKDWYAKCSGKP